MLPLPNPGEIGARDQARSQSDSRRLSQHGRRVAGRRTQGTRDRSRRTRQGQRCPRGARRRGGRRVEGFGSSRRGPRIPAQVDRDRRPLRGRGPRPPGEGRVRPVGESTVVYRLLADATVALHAAFVIFVVGGGLLAARWPRIAWLHLPAVAWGAWVELAGWICPLSPLENWLRAQSGGAAYTSGFIEHYLVPVLYPAALTRPVQRVLAGLAILVNVTVY